MPSCFFPEAKLLLIYSFDMVSLFLFKNNLLLAIGFVIFVEEIYLSQF